MKTSQFAALGMVLALTGCDVPELETPQAAAPAPTGQVATAPEASSPVEQTQPAQDPAVSQQSSNPGSPNPNEPPPVTSTPREVSDLDPTKGKKSRAAGGYLGAVAGARFYAEHSLIFDQVRQALELYNAEHGNYPKSQEEFLKVIIRPNNIGLPPLDPGVEYLYDPEDHKLKVWRPEDTETAPEPVEPE
jgi:hypothetical protein